VAKDIVRRGEAAKKGTVQDMFNQAKETRDKAKILEFVNLYMVSRAQDALDHAKKVTIG
jgi:hypothetical protein